MEFQTSSDKKMKILIFYLLQDDNIYIHIIYIQARIICICIYNITGIG